MEKEVIHNFWRSRATTGQSRWTTRNFVEYELNVLRNLKLENTKVLDLGCGFGDLSREYCKSEGELHAIDMEPLFAKWFTESNHFFEDSEVTEFNNGKTYDLILLFGVVTHLTLGEENVVYSNIASMKDDSGVAIVKNQCSVEDEFIFDGFSEELRSRYVGRYPSIAEQLARLKSHFSSVETMKYPPDLRVHQNSEHVMFLCR
jgi:SAM-dependent methyltransferase